ncbi:sialidase family protein [Fodinicola acaciae]|uniref:sialidase family protein n=1 Tax=Fodinicola acaciae TaxID=2681555 RepID=UPI0013D351FC|nr:sialidase family protein [Fodinicola acaciae]
MSPINDQQVRDIRTHVIHAVPLASAAELRALARRRSVRGRVVGAAAAVSAVLLLAGGLYGTQRIVSQPASPADGGVLAMAVPDGHRAYAVMRSKRGDYELALSTDAGAHWSWRQLPDQLRQAAAKASPPPSREDPVTGAGQALFPPIQVVGPTSVVIGSMITTDNGASWKTAGAGGAPVPKSDPHNRDPILAVGAPVAVAPAGWRLRVRIGQPDARTVDAVDPATGVDHPLRTQPGNSPFIVKTTPDASIWAIGNPSQGVTSIAVSHDRGATWSPSTVDDKLSNGYQEVATRDGRTVYLLGGPDARREDADGKPTTDGAVVPLGIRTSTDGGRTWGPRVPATGAFEIQNVVVLPDGSLVGTASGLRGTTAVGGGWAVGRSTDGGRTFARVADLPSLDGLAGSGDISGNSRDGYVIVVLGSSTVAEPGRYLLSADGLHWRRLPMPD